MEHRSLYRKSNHALHGELLHLSERIAELGIVPLPAFRPPYGHIRPDSALYLHRRGLQTVLWTHIPGDFRPWPSDALLKRALKNLKPGCILVMHDGTPLRPAPVLELTQRLLDYIEQKGWRAAPLTPPLTTGDPMIRAWK
jgi:peptidoglycan/xylan/chitin deacetylase (PgdA/CDA1 family)